MRRNDLFDFELVIIFITCNYQNTAGQFRNAEEWFHPAGNQQFGYYTQKIFLRNLSAETTIDDIRLAFVGSDPEAARQVIKRKASATKEEKEKALRHNIELSPVVAIHLVRDDLDDIAAKFMYDLPKEHSPTMAMYTDGATNSDSGSGQENATKNDIIVKKTVRAPLSLDPDADLKCDDNAEVVQDQAYAFDSEKTRANFIKKLDSNRVKTALLKVSHSDTCFLSLVIFLMVLNICSADQNPGILCIRRNEESSGA